MYVWFSHGVCSLSLFIAATKQRIGSWERTSSVHPPGLEKPEASGAIHLARIFFGGGVTVTGFGVGFHDETSKCPWVQRFNKQNWLVVWNMSFIFPYIGNNNPN